MDALLRRRLMMQQGGGPTPPPGPQPVFYERLRFDGTAYIKTDLVIPQNGSIVAGFGNETLHAAQRLYNAGDASSRIRLILGSATNNTNRAVTNYYETTAVGSISLAFSTSTWGWWQTPKRYGIGSGTVYTFTKTGTHKDSYLFIGKDSDADTGQAYTGTVQYFYLYGADAQNATSRADLLTYTPFSHLVPCLLGYEAGLWDLENDKFYGNSAGAGSLSVEGNIITY